MSRNPFKSDVRLAEKYRDPQTGIEGTATSIHFYQFACERVTIETLTKDGYLKEYTFDAPRLEHAETKAKPRTDRTGGPGDGIGQASSQASAPSR